MFVFLFVFLLIGVLVRKILGERKQRLRCTQSQKALSTVAVDENNQNQGLLDESGESPEESEDAVNVDNK